MATRMDDYGFGAEIRKSPFFAATLRWGAQAFSVYNHMYIPRSFGDPERNFWTLVEHAILCDVGAERQVEVTGPDAARFAQMLTPRDLSKCEVGQCKYVLITDAAGGVLNDPVMLRLAENRFWFSLADSDILLWAKGLAAHAGLDVQVGEPDVSPLQLQGPKSRAILATVLGDWIESLGYFRFRETELDGIPLVVSRTGWSSELGYELYLRDGAHGDALWERLMEAGRPFGLEPGHTSAIRRIEGAMLSYRADMDATVNPFELGLDRLVDLDMDAPFMGKDALRAIRDRGVSRRQVGLTIDGPRLAGPNTTHWAVSAGGRPVGKVTSAVHSPRLAENIALALVDTDSAEIGTELTVALPDGERTARVVPKPFYDPRKTRASA